MARPMNQNQDGMEEKVIQISRVSKKTKGGNTIGFSVVMVVGDKQGKVGVAKGKAPDVVSAIRKGVKKARKRMIDVPLDGTTVPFKVLVKQGAAQLLLKPAPRGTGVIAGGPVRAVLEAAGIRDISSKILGSGNQASNAYATFTALKKIANLVQIKGISLRSLAQVEAEEKKKEEELQQKAKEHDVHAQEVRKEAKEVAKKTETKKPAAKKVVAKPAAKKAAPKKVAAKK
jgi:small subunit ribosomal protein S5